MPAYGVRPGPVARKQDGAFVTEATGIWSVTCPLCCAPPGVLCSDSRVVFRKACNLRETRYLMGRV